MQCLLLCCCVYVVFRTSLECCLCRFSTVVVVFCVRVCARVAMCSVPVCWFLMPLLQIVSPTQHLSLRFLFSENDVKNSKKNLCVLSCETNNCHCEMLLICTAFVLLLFLQACIVVLRRCHLYFFIFFFQLTTLPYQPIYCKGPCKSILNPNW